MPTIKDECMVLLFDYRWVINKLSQEFFDMPYNRLPKWAKVDVKAGARRYAAMRINDLIERGK